MSKIKVSRFFPSTKKGEETTESHADKRRRHRLLSSYEQARNFDDSRKNGKDQNNGAEDGSITNIYACIKMGIKWWRYLAKTGHRKPTYITRPLLDELRDIDVSDLEARFGAQPTKADMPAIEEFLNIDLFTLYGGKFSPLGISYRSRARSRSLSSQAGGGTVEDALDALERPGGRPVVVLQSARAYFHKLGAYHVIPTRRVAEDRDKDWISFWRALAKHRGAKSAAQISAKIYEMKTELQPPFTIADGTFQKIRSKYKVPVRLYIGKIVNDNLNNKVCYFATQPVKDKEYLNLIVASYLPDEFDKEFKKLSNMSYNELRRNPTQCPILAADRQSARIEAADRAAAAAEIIDIDDDDILDFDNLTDNEVDDDEEEDDYGGAYSYLDDVAAEERENDVDDQIYRPIRNVASLAPNVFDANTTVRVLGKREVFMMPVCPTKNCLYSHEKPSYMSAHIKNCKSEPTIKIRQSVQGSDVIDYVYELAEEGYLPSADYSQEFFATYDIECLMSAGMDVDDGGGDNNDETLAQRKFHNLATLASLCSDGEKRGFIRKDMSEGSVTTMITEYINYLIEVRERLPVPKCILRGIDYYTDELGIKERRLKYSFDQLPALRKKLQYLRDFTKLKIYSWCGERYDLRVIFSSVAACMSEFAKARKSRLWPIKRGDGYMMLEAVGICFRDFRNYTAPMSLAELASSCDLAHDEFAKGSFCYEWYTDVDQLNNAFEFPCYTCFYSTMYTGAFHRGHEYVKEINNISAENKFTHIGDLAEFLYLDSLLDDPVLKGRNTRAIFANTVAKLNKIFQMDRELGCLQCDPRNIEAREFFRFSPKVYRKSRELWDKIAADLERQNSCNVEQQRMTMMRFLMNYNFNDVRLLKASIDAYATSYQRKFKVGLHADLSIAKMAQKSPLYSMIKACRRCIPRRQRQRFFTMIAAASYSAAFARSSIASFISIRIPIGEFRKPPRLRQTASATKAWSASTSTRCIRALSPRIYPVALESFTMWTRSTQSALVVDATAGISARANPFTPC